jgi:gamma-glutamyl-gamma-aminobutyrate hydrolase PuuD
MFHNQGWQIVPNIDESSLVQFTGGADVSPMLYGQYMHNRTRADLDRDKRDIAVWRIAEQMGLPMAGICRGGQFLNVMCGGSMWQDVNEHAIGKGHEMMCHLTGEVEHVTSTHHQMMIPSKGGIILGTALESYRKERHTSESGPTIRTLTRASVHSPIEEQDIEAVFYVKENVLCFQPHPEFHGQKKLADKYFEYIDLLFSPLPAILDYEEDKKCVA